MKRLLRSSTASKAFTASTAFLLFAAPALAAQLTNPLGTTNINVIIGRVIQAILGVTGSIALLMFIYGGFLFLTDAGRGDGVKKGKEIIKYSTLGLAIIIGAYMMVKTVVSALESGTVL